MGKTRILKSIGYKTGYVVDRALDADSIQRFIRRAYPILTEHELVKVGSDGDGGYLIPNDLDGIEACFSPGVGNTSDFECELAERNIKCFLADFSVEKPPAESAAFHFVKKFIGAHNSKTHIRMDDWISAQNLPGCGDLILQMDIEGDEYEVLLDISANLLTKFRIIVVEFHGLDAIFHPVGNRLIQLVFGRLLSEFSIVHIHPNNCREPVRCMDFSVPPVMEFTFLRNDRISERSYSMRFPHPLDSPCVKENKDYVLPDCWHASHDYCRINSEFP